MQTSLNEQIKSLIVETLMLQISPAELADEQALFGPASLGLDSVDALQLVVMLDKNFGLKIADSNVEFIGRVAVPRAVYQPAPSGHRVRPRLTRLTMGGIDRHHDLHAVATGTHPAQARYRIEVDPAIVTPGHTTTRAGTTPCDGDGGAAVELGQLELEDAAGGERDPATVG